MINKSTLISFSQKNNYILDCIYSNIKRKFDWLRIGQSILSMLPLTGQENHSLSATCMLVQGYPFLCRWLHENPIFWSRLGRSQANPLFIAAWRFAVWILYGWIISGGDLCCIGDDSLQCSGILNFLGSELVFKSKNLNAKKQLWISFAAEIGS